MGEPPLDHQRIPGQHLPECSYGPAALPPALRVSAFIVRRGRILLVRQQTAVQSYWLLPGGGVDRGESLIEAVARETREECGLEVEVLDAPLALVESISPDSGASRHLVQLVFPAILLDGTEPTAGDSAVREVGWFTVDDLGGLVIHPPIHDLLVSWMDFFGQSVGAPLPPFVAVGRRWVD